LRLKVTTDPAQALQIDTHLIETAGRADVQCSQSAGADHAVGFQTMSRLKAAHRLVQLVVVAQLQRRRAAGAG